MQVYIATRSEANFTHGICPGCTQGQLGKMGLSIGSNGSGQENGSDN